MQNALRIGYRFVLPWLAFFGILASFKYGLLPLAPVQEQPLSTIIWRFIVPMLAWAMLLSFSRPFNGRYIMQPYSRREYDPSPPVAWVAIMIAIALSGTPLLASFTLTDDNVWQVVGSFMLYLIGCFTLIWLAAGLGQKAIHRLFGADYEAGKIRYWRKGVEQCLEDPLLADAAFQKLRDSVNDTLEKPLTGKQLSSLYAMLRAQLHLREKQVQLENTLNGAGKLRAEAQQNLDNHQQVLEKVLGDFNAA